MSDALADKMQQYSNNAKQTIKSKIFDILSIIILICLILISLGVIERRDVTLNTIGDILVECIPLFFAATLLNKNFYMKGSFTGKSSTKFTTACTDYSSQIEKLTGEQIDVLDDFCQDFNEEALVKTQTVILKQAGISYDKFNELKILSYVELVNSYGKERAKLIQKAKRCKVKGLRVNVLLGTNDSDDITDVGPTEASLSRKHSLSSSFNYLLSVILMSLIGVKNMAEWGWFGALLVLFKCVYIFCRSYMSYFDGYNDITIRIVNHINRKTDILKQFFSWYTGKTKIKEPSSIDV